MHTCQRPEQHGQLSVVQELLRFGPNLDLKTTEGRTALDVAVYFSFIEAQEAIRAKMAEAGSSSSSQGGQSASGRRRRREPDEPSASGAAARPSLPREAKKGKK